MLTAQRVVPGVYPCSLVSGCVAAHSVVRRLVATYTGNLFQLSKSGGSTQNIGQTAAGQVDTAAIATFCGSAWPMSNGAGANACAYHIIYDQTANANDITAVGADVPFASDSVRSLPKMVFGTGLNYFNGASPTNLHTGANDKSVFVVTNDTKFSDCCGIYGQAHSTAASGSCPGAGTAPDCNGTDFMAMVRASGAATEGDCRRFGTDLEIDVAEVCYAPDDRHAASNVAQMQTVSAWGDFTGITTYTASSKTVLVDFNGLYTYSNTYSNGVLCSGTTCDNQIRVGAGGDASTVFGILYEGIIFNKALSAGDRQQLERNAQAYYGITPAPACANAPRSSDVIEVLGASNVTGAWGLRRIDPHQRGAVAELQRASDSAINAIGTIGCDFDSAAAATFCNSTTCRVVTLFNQALEGIGQLVIYTTTLADTWKMGSVNNGGPPYVANCLGSLPCMTLTASDSIGTNGLQSWPSPYTVFVVGKNTTTGTNYGGMLNSGTGSHPYLGKSNAINSAMFQADDSGPVACTNCATDGSWFAFGGQANDSSHSSVWVQGGQTGPTSATVTNSSTTLRFGISFSFTGSITEGAVSFTNVSSGNMQTITAGQKAYWGF